LFNLVENCSEKLSCRQIKSTIQTKNSTKIRTITPLHFLLSKALIDSKFKLIELLRTVCCHQYYLSIPNSEKEIRHPFGSIGLEYFRRKRFLVRSEISAYWYEPENSEFRKPAFSEF
jgi:hypothetical protein